MQKLNVTSLAELVRFDVTASGVRSTYHPVPYRPHGVGAAVVAA
jgi:hypothetical protein